MSPLQLTDHSRQQQKKKFQRESFQCTVNAPNFPPLGNFPNFLGKSVAPLGGFSHKNE
jgi:hypothetical protein